MVMVALMLIVMICSVVDAIGADSKRNFPGRAVKAVVVANWQDHL